MSEKSELGTDLGRYTSLEASAILGMLIAYRLPLKLGDGDEAWETTYKAVVKESIRVMTKRHVLSKELILSLARNALLNRHAQNVYSARTILEGVIKLRKYSEGDEANLTNYINEVIVLTVAKCGSTDILPFLANYRSVLKDPRLAKISFDRTKITGIAPKLYSGLLEFHAILRLITSNETKTLVVGDIDPMYISEYFMILANDLVGVDHIDLFSTKFTRFPFAKYLCK